MTPELHRAQCARAPAPIPNSRPGAGRTAYLDFDGHTTTGTPWNAGHSDSLLAPAFDRDGRPDAFSDAERREVVAIWEAVAEDYAGFALDVTTGGRVGWLARARALLYARAHAPARTNAPACTTVAAGTRARASPPAACLPALADSPACQPARLAACLPACCACLGPCLLPARLPPDRLLACWMPACMNHECRHVLSS